VVEIRDGDAVVAVGALKVTLPMKRLYKTEHTPTPPAVQIRGDVPDVYVPNEVDLRGLRVSDIEDVVMHAVDNAVRADLKVLRIIHGKGTGALRERVGEMLRKEPRVVNFRLGAWNEGGAGVTVVEFA
jgi:DNA mismatch repair protein MutS2